MDKKILQIIEEVKALDNSLQRDLLEALFAGFGRKDRLRWFNLICHFMYPKSKWQKIERWMEGQFRRDIVRTPRMVASMAVNYFRINSKMMPFLIKMAQRVKHRIRMRVRNHPERYESQK